MLNKPLRALRRFCLDCQGEDRPSVMACRDEECFFYAWRWLAGEFEGGVMAAPEHGAPDLAAKANELDPEPAAGPDNREKARLLPATGQDPEDGDGAVAQGSAVRAEIPRFPTENPLRVMRRFCLDCGGNRAEVRHCDAKDSCPLWSYRFGVLPSTFKRVFARRRKTRSALTLPGL